MTSKSKLHWRNIHRWIGIILTVFILLFCVSGLILNHRSAFVNCNVDRWLLPDDYTISNFNNGSIKGTLPIDSIRILAFGNVGVWLTDPHFSKLIDFNTGLPDGMDSRNIRSVIMTPDSALWCASQYNLFRHNGEKWEAVPLAGNKDKISDLTLNGSKDELIVLTRSCVYTLPLYPSLSGAKRIQLQAPDNLNNKVSLFKTFWQLHSGELFGLTGRIIVDIIAIIIILLCITGIIMFILPYSIRKSAHHSDKNSTKRNSAILKWNDRWHNRIGYFTIILTVLISFTGMCLRPPFMIPLVLVKTPPLPGSNLENKNAWHDKLRGIRWDTLNNRWLISTSEGFIHVNENFSDKPISFSSLPTPPVSPMGITVFEETNPGEWLIGSFSGLYKWNTIDGLIYDYNSGVRYNPEERGKFASGQLVSGFSSHLDTDSPVVFTYAEGASEVLPPSSLLESQPMSLWNAALELHVGRCYSPFLGPISEFFVFLSGFLLTLILISGFIISTYRKRRNK